MAAVFTPRHHPVLPQITDPALVPRSEPEILSGDPVTIKDHEGFFQRNKFYLVVSLVVLIIAIVVIYVFLSRSSPSPKKGKTADGLHNINVEEINRVRTIRQLQRGGPSQAVILAGQLQPDGAPPSSRPALFQTPPPPPSAIPQQRPAAAPPAGPPSSQHQQRPAAAPPAGPPSSQRQQRPAAAPPAGREPSSSQRQRPPDPAPVSGPVTDETLDDLIESLQDEASAAEDE